MKHLTSMLYTMDNLLRISIKAVSLQRRRKLMWCFMIFNWNKISSLTFKRIKMLLRNNSHLLGAFIMSM